jgi:hypothetical protein
MSPLVPLLKYSSGAYSGSMQIFSWPAVMSPLGAASTAAAEGAVLAGLDPPPQAERDSARIAVPRRLAVFFKSHLTFELVVQLTPSGDEMTVVPSTSRGKQSNCYLADLAILL